MNDREEIKAISFIEQQKRIKEQAQGNSPERVFSIGKDNSGNIWFGTAEFGAWKYEGHSVKNFTKAADLRVNSSGLYIKANTGNCGFEEEVQLGYIDSMAILLNE